MSKANFTPDAGHSRRRGARFRNRAAIDAQYADWLARTGNPTKPGKVAPRRTPRSGPVTVRSAGGTTSVVPALSPADLRKVVKERRSIPDGQRARISRRDRGMCRYCGSGAPHHIDHVIPVALGGPTTDRNLVLACVDCNQRKSDSVWRPLPIGHYLR